MPTNSVPESLFIGLMSGTSLDGVDGVLCAFPNDPTHQRARSVSSAHIGFPADLRAELAALQNAGQDEIRREAIAANRLAHCYADCVEQLLIGSGYCTADVVAIGCHGQTIRHRPELGFTRQSNNPALLAELCGIDVIADFRSRDIAAGGQGAPLVPAFHRWLFAGGGAQQVIANIGGISNISILPPDTAHDTPTLGFDTGPGNVLLDGWIDRTPPRPAL